VDLTLFGALAMSGLNFAASLLRDAMSSSEATPPPRAETQSPTDIAELAAALNRQRAETESNFENVARVLRASERTVSEIRFESNAGGIRPHAALWSFAILAVAASARGYRVF